MVPYPYGTPPPWWGQGKAAAGEAARRAIEEGKRKTNGAFEKPTKRLVSAESLMDWGLFGEGNE